MINFNNINILPKIFTFFEKNKFISLIKNLFQAFYLIKLCFCYNFIKKSIKFNLSNK